LISLIQQMGCDLSTNIQKKLDWLQYAIVELDPHDANISPYIVSVLTEIQQNVDMLDEEFARNARLLKHTIVKILTKFPK